MEIKVSIPDDKLEELIKEVMQNMPDACLSMACMKWKYDECSYAFEDYEDGKKYDVDLPKLKTAMEKMMKDTFEAKKNQGLDISSSVADFMDPCNWDAGCVDALVQYAIFGEVVYG